MSSLSLRAESAILPVGNIRRTILLQRGHCPEVCCGRGVSSISPYSSIHPFLHEEFASEGNIAVSHDEALALLSVRKQAVVTYGAPEIQMDRE